MEARQHRSQDSIFDKFFNKILTWAYRDDNTIIEGEPAWLIGPKSIGGTFRLRQILPHISHLTAPYERQETRGGQRM